MTPRRLVKLLALSAGVYAIAVRPGMLRWGASDTEVQQPYPGGDVVSGYAAGRPWFLQMDRRLFFCEPAHWRDADAPVRKPKAACRAPADSSIGMSAFLIPDRANQAGFMNFPVARNER
jgi:hypothetical protein